MEILVFIFFGYVLLQFFPGLLTGLFKQGFSNSRPNTPSRTLSQRLDDSDGGSAKPETASEIDSQEWEKLKSNVRTISSAQAKNFGRRQAEMRERIEAANTKQMEAAAPSRARRRVSSDVRNRNPSRRSDWGRGGGAEILSTRNLLLVIVFALIIYLVLELIKTF